MRHCEVVSHSSLTEWARGPLSRLLLKNLLSKTLVISSGKKGGAHKIPGIL